MNIFKDIENEIKSAVAAVFGGEFADQLSFTVEPPRDAAHGDMASNVAMALAKPLGKKPREIAEALQVKLLETDVVDEIDIAGPGFINISLKSTIWSDLLNEVVQTGDRYGSLDLGAGKSVNVEYVSANPTGPLHVGHMRGAVVGDSLANLLEFAGYDVTREYYINDGGAQVDVLARSIYLRYMEQFGHNVEFPDGTYPGDYLVEVGASLKNKFGDQFLDQPEDVWLETFREEGVAAMMELIRSDLSALGVHMDKFFSERSLYETGQIEAAIAKLESDGLIYKGTLPPPKGKPSEDWEAREQMLFKSTQYGDDVDRPIQKSDGNWTYFAPDIAYHFDKIERGYSQLIDVLGADHGGYVKRMQAAVRALSHGEVELAVKLCQLVKLFKNGEPFKMSKRAGNFVLISDVIEEVGADVARFEILMRKSDAPMDFDFDKVKEESKDNPVFYVQYAHARAQSVLEKGGNLSNLAKLDRLITPQEMTIMKILANFPRVVGAAAISEEPHRIAYYLYELASEFHSLQHQGKLDKALRFIVADDDELTQARLTLVRGVQQVIANGLQILGVSPMNEM